MKIPQINTKKLAKYLAKPVCFISLFVTSAYGVKTMLNTLPEFAAFMLTGLLVGCLGYILFIDD